LLFHEIWQACGAWAHTSVPNVAFTLLKPSNEQFVSVGVGPEGHCGQELYFGNIIGTLAQLATAHARLTECCDPISAAKVVRAETPAESPQPGRRGITFY
jgi:hypothetical protein